MLTMVSASRWPQGRFAAQALLGRCLPGLGEHSPVALRLAAGNRRPLAEHYNAAIEAAAPEDVLVFVHDDVHVDDWLLAQRVDEALQRYDVVGVAGNRRVQARQVAWYLQPGAHGSSEPGPWDTGFLSGAIRHAGATGRLSVYGPSPQAVRLLDGVFIAARAGRLRDSGVRFDPALGFHFYDLDFCLSAHRAGLSLGTWPIALTHASGGGSIQSPAWRDARRLYLDKWFHE